VRRARNKHVGLYRRQASARVATKGARGAARPANRLNSDRAEVFELALARVSARLGVVARAAATELKAERLAAAREVKAGTGPDSVASTSSATSVPSAKRRATKTTGGLKRDASSQRRSTHGRMPRPGGGAWSRRASGPPGRREAGSGAWLRRWVTAYLFQPVAESRCVHVDRGSRHSWRG
jgi:hypothetical protein